MSSTLTDLILATRRYINEEDSTNSHHTDSEITDYLNQGQTFLGSEMEWNIQTDVATVVSGTALYALPDDFLVLLDCYFDNRRITILERADLARLSSTWQNDIAAIPNVAYKAAQNTIGLYPAPDTTQNGKVLQIQYVRMPATLINSSDIPDVHTAYQMCLPFYAAYLCDKKDGNLKNSLQHLSEYNDHRKALMSKVQRWADDIYRFKWSWNNLE